MLDSHWALPIINSLLAVGWIWRFSRLPGQRAKQLMGWASVLGALATLVLIWVTHPTMTAWVTQPTWLPWLMGATAGAEVFGLTAVFPLFQVPATFPQPVQPAWARLVISVIFIGLVAWICQRQGIAPAFGVSFIVMGLTIGLCRNSVNWFGFVLAKLVFFGVLGLLIGFGSGWLFHGLPTLLSVGGWLRSTISLSLLCLLTVVASTSPILNRFWFGQPISPSPSTKK